MAKKPAVAPPCLKAFDAAADDDKKNRLLLAWLSDDKHRAALYELINQERDGILPFPSRDAKPIGPCCPDDEHPRPPPEIGHKTVYLVTSRYRIEKALLDGGTVYSNRPYGELGGGNFVLALDPATTGVEAHKAQVKAMCHSFPHDPGQITLISHHACQSAAILSLRAQDFDLATFAEQAALRFCQNLFGYAGSDFTLLEAALRASYRALVHQVMARHFVTDPVALPKATQLTGPLLVRTAALIDAYASCDEDVLKGCEVSAALAGLEPVMKKLAGYRNELNGHQRAVIAVGAAIGSVGNVQAAVCIAVQALFADEKLLQAAQQLARTEKSTAPTGKLHEWQALIRGALGRNPPIPFLPRLVIPEVDDRPAFSEILLALGGATLDAPADKDDPMIWGLPPEGRHWCLGLTLAWPLIAEVVRHVMGLPGLAERLDPLDASVIGLEKRWGFVCESYPLSYQRDRRVAQNCLNVAMKIKAPVKDNATRLRGVIRSGAPLIHEALREARHVHFAWFEFIERDTVLVLHTVYDGEFAAYIQHFALRVGDLFDTLFEFIEDAPPVPVAKHPNEFVTLIKRYNRAPAMGYFFSAYPRSEAARIMREEGKRP